MKVAMILLLVAVGVASAAFSGSLTQRTQPLLNSMQLKASIASSSIARGNQEKGEILDQIIQAVVAQAQALIEQIQETLGDVAGGVIQVGTEAYIQIQKTIAALKAIAAQAQGQVVNVINALIDKLQELIGNGESVAQASRLTAQLNLRGLAALLQQVLEALASNIVDSDLVQGLIAQLEGWVGQYPFLQSLINRLLALLNGDGKVSTKDLQSIIQGVIAIIQGGGSNIIQEIQALIQKELAAIIQQGQAQAVAAINQLIQVVNSSPLPQALKNVLLAQLNEILASLTGNGKAAAKDLQSLIQGIVAIVQGGGSDVIQQIQALIQKELAAIIQQGQAQAVAAINQLIQVVNGSPLPQALKDRLLAQLNQILASIGASGRAANKDLQSIIQGVIAIIQGGGANILEEIQALIQKELAVIIQQGQAQAVAAVNQLIQVVQNSPLPQGLKNALLAQLNQILASLGASGKAADKDLQSIIQGVIAIIQGGGSDVIQQIQALIQKELAAIIQQGQAQAVAAINQLIQVVNGSPLPQALKDRLLAQLNQILASIGASGRAANKDLQSIIQGVIAIIQGGGANIVEQIQALIEKELAAIIQQGQAQAVAAINQLIQVVNGSPLPQALKDRLLAQLNQILASIGASGKSADKDLQSIMQGVIAIIQGGGADILQQIRELVIEELKPIIAQGQAQAIAQINGLINALENGPVGQILPAHIKDALLNQLKEILAVVSSIPTRALY